MTTKDPSNKKPKIGRPSKFTPELVDEILLKLSEGMSERAIFDNDDYPTWRAWFNFKMTEVKAEGSTFLQQYARAKEMSLKCWEKRIIEISHDESRDLIPDGKGSFKSDNTAVNRDRLKVDSLKWLMSKLAPKVYGEKIEQEVTGAEGKPLIPVLNVTIEK